MLKHVAVEAEGAKNIDLSSMYMMNCQNSNALFATILAGRKFGKMIMRRLPVVKPKSDKLHHIGIFLRPLTRFFGWGSRIRTGAQEGNSFLLYH